MDIIIELLCYLLEQLFDVIIYLWIKYVQKNSITTKDIASSTAVVTPIKRLRAGGLVAKEKATGIPYRSLNVRRGNAMRYLVLDYIKQKVYSGKNILLPTLTEDKRKAMENIAANEFFKCVDAYTPEEHFFPLHIKPSGELYYVPEKKVKQMLYVVNKLKKCSLESIVSDVTWESSSLECEDDDEDQFILDFKTDKVLAKANHCELLANEVEQFYFNRNEAQAAQPDEDIPQKPTFDPDCTNIRRSISLPIIKVPKVKRRIKKLPTLSKSVSDDKLNIFLADINQHRLVNIRSIEQIEEEKKEILMKELYNVGDEMSQQNEIKHVHFETNQLKNANRRQNLRLEENPSTSQMSDDSKQPIFYDLIDNKQPKFYDLIDQNDDSDTYDEVNDTIYREINEVKASICAAQEKMGQKFRLTKDDLDMTIENYNKQQLTMNNDGKEKIDISQPSTSSGVYQKQRKSIPILENDKDTLKEDKNFNARELYLMEKLLKDERVLNKTKQIIKMKRRVELDDDTRELTNEQILDRIRNRPKRFNIYTLQKLQTEFDTSSVGDTRMAMETSALNVDLNQPEASTSTKGLQMEMKNFNKNDSDSITDGEMSDVDESVHKRYIKKLKKKIINKRASNSKLDSLSSSLSNIPIIGRFFQRKS